MGLPMKKIHIKPMFAWYDLWRGVFIDTKKHCIYVFPIPMFGIKISWKAGKENES